MPRLLPSTAAVRKQFLPAWVFSFLLHSALIVWLGWELRHAPRGVEQPGGSIGIVLNHTGDENNRYEGDDAEAGTYVKSDELPQAPELLEPPSDDLAGADVGADITQVAMAAPSATAKREQPTAQQTKPNSVSASSRPITSGAGGGGSPDGRGYAQTSVFGVEGKGNKFIYVFDRSSSMEGPPLAAAKRQLLESLQSLDSIHQFHIIFFNTKTQSLKISGGGRRIAFASDRNKKLAGNFVGGITADGGTDRLTALREAIAFSPDVIFFLTDADDPLSASELADIARANRRNEAAICVIEFGRRPAPLPDNFLARLARESGGQYGYVDTTKLSPQVSTTQPAAP